MKYKTVIAGQVRRILPYKIAGFFLQHPSIFIERGKKWQTEDPYRNEKSEWVPTTNNSKYKIGIIKEFWHLHWPFIAACRELNISYKILDISQPDWFMVLKKSSCDAFLCRPSVQYKVWKEMYDERLKTFAANDDRIIFPDPEALWIWESKRRVHYWLESHDIPHPKSWVFYDQEQSLAFSDKCSLPIVFKSDMGSGASGVKIFKERKSLRRHIKRCFVKGFSTYRRIRNDREYGSVFFQEYLPEVREWRMVRIGDSFFGYEKGVSSDGFHSGSQKFLYGRPPDEVLNLCKGVTDADGFKSLNVDIFVTPDGRLLVNELQAIMGQAGSREICRINDQSGRMRWDEQSKEWVFEKGLFCQNFLCNLRVKTLIQMLENSSNSNRNKPEPNPWPRKF